jgi:hypothetical protein
MKFKSLFAIIILISITALILTACSSSTAPEDAVTDYLNALVNKDASKLSALSCADWEPNALLELDSFQAVEVRLEDLSCASTGSEGNTTFVQCQGKIIATYNTENMEINLADKSYKIVEQNGNYLVCGYK